MLIIVFVAMAIYLMNHVVSSSEQHGPPASWWSIEEIFSQYIEVQDGRDQFPRPV